MRDYGTTCRQKREGEVTMDSTPDCLQISVHDDIATPLREFVKTKAREGKGRPIVEQVSGDDVRKQTGQWVRRTMLINRKEDQYMEHVVDPASGEVHHHWEEPLSQHRGHGDAKRQG